MKRFGAVLLKILPVALLGCVMTLVVNNGRNTVFGGFTTSLIGRTPPQLHNIRQTVRALDGKIVRPNEVFSFNKTIGMRTAERGYTAAPAIVEGRIEEIRGGGVCQVASTLYNAALLAGLEIVERHHHSYPVSSVPPGQDATVAFERADLKFRNTLAVPITIRAKVSGEHLLVRIAGPGRKRSEYRLVVEIDKLKQPVLAGGGVRGTQHWTATVWREELRNGQIVGREFVSVDTYDSQLLEAGG